MLAITTPNIKFIALTILRFYLRLLSVFLLLLLPLASVGQQRLIFKTYSVEEGLISNTIWSIGQDGQGYMWFGTRNGLSRFDGYEFKTYQYSNVVPHSLGNNFVHSIFTVDQNTMWIGTSRGVYILDLTTEQFTKLKGIGEITVNDMQRDEDNNIWIATSRGLFKYIFKTQKIEKPDTAIRRIRKIAIDFNGIIWIGTTGGGIVAYNPDTDKLKRYADEKDGLLSGFTLTVFVDKEGNVWSGSFGGGLSLFVPEEDKFKHYVRENSGISSDIVRSLLQVNHDELLIGTERGLNILDLKTQTFTNYLHDPSDVNSLSGNAIYSIFKDKSDGIWLGSYFGGVSYYSNNTSGFERFYPGQGENTLSGGGVSAIVEKEPGKFWIGTEDAGLNFYDAESGTFQKYPFEARQQPLSYFNILSLAYVDQELWIGTFSGGLNIYNEKTGNVRKYDNRDKNNFISGNNVHCIYQDREGTVWVGTSLGLSRYDKQTKKFTKVDRLGQRFITDIYEDDAGTLWIAVNGGDLFGQRKKTGDWVRYNFRSDKDFYGVGRFSITEDHEGHLWLATDGNGLVRFNFRDETFDLYNGKDYGIDANLIYDILQQDDRTLWLSTNNGIYHFDWHKEKTTHYTKWDNLQSNEFNYNAGFIASDGKMFFGGINGFNSFYPDSVKIRDLKGSVVINELQLFNDDVSLDQPEQEILKKTINFTDELTLNHNQSVVSFEYAAINFESPQKVKYAYKMDGFDERWNYVDTQRKATYTNLPPGDYTFMVKATNDERSWDGPATSIALTINPPFYRHPLAYFFYFILVIAMILLARKVLLDRAERRNRLRVQQLSVEREREFYNHKIEFFTTMAHEIRTPLSLITAPLEKLMENTELPKKVMKPLTIMDENAKRLINLVNQLLDFRRIESDIYEIRKEQLDLITLLQSIYSRFSAMKYQKKINFTMSTKMPKQQVMADPEALTKIFNNLLINAFKFTRSEVRMSIQKPVYRDGKKYSCITIKDDGIGIPEEELQNIFKKYFKVAGNSPSANLLGTGIGLNLAKSLIEKHGGFLEVESELDVNTTFKVFLPLQDLVETPEDAVEIDEKTEVLADEPKEKNTESREQILVVEDDMFLLDFFEQNLEQDDFAVIRASNGAEAWELLKANDVDLILSDVMMPEIDGIELCKMIKTNPEYSHIPVILLTAKTNSDAEIAGIQSGADAYIAKPFKWKHVMAMIENLLKSRAKLKNKFATQPFISADSLTENMHDKKLLEKIIASIEERIMDPNLSVKELGRELGMSRSNLHKKLKSVSGKVPNEFIRLIRLKHGAKLLLTNEYTVSEVSYMSGFNSHSYFSKCFFKQFNITPSDFVEKNMKLPEDENVI